jgi:pyridoxal 5'-phosphate synthase pdxT subunit
MKNIKVGVLALQGDFREHLNILKKINAGALEVRLPSQIDYLDGLIIPGGESTAISKLMGKYGFDKKIKQFALSGKPLFGTCAGLIILSNRIENEKEGLGLIDIDVKRNAYGRQIESFEDDIELNLDHGKYSKRFNSVFIRAPKIIRTGKEVRILAKHNDGAVLAREKNILVSTFHPELTDDKRIHEYFITMILEYLEER